MGSSYARGAVPISTRHSWAAVLYLVIACNAPGNAEATEPMRSCAITPTYRYFEQIQYAAYASNPEFQKLLITLRSPQRIQRTLDKTGKDLDKRENPLGGKARKSKNVNDYITRSLKSRKLPTCYENPLLFFMLSQYAMKINSARKALNLPLQSQINLATLPTTEVNAYTYPATQDVGSVIAMNSQLFMFAYQMTKVTIPTIGIRKDNTTSRVAVDHSIQRANQAIESNPDLKINFSMALLEFLGLTSPSTQPLAQSYDSLVISFTQGMEMFALAHEYGHVIKQHTSPTTTVTLGVDDGQNASARSVPVLARSWKQELEADQVGVQLLIQALRSKAKSNAAEDLRWVYSLKGALFFFRCLDIVDQAKALRDTGKVPPEPTMVERAFVRAFADGKTSASENEAFGYLTTATHPPHWVRLERVREAIESALRSNSPSPSSLEFSAIADGIEQNVEVIWRSIYPRFPLLIKTVSLQKANPDKLQDRELLESLREANLERRVAGYRIPRRV